MTKANAHTKPAPYQSVRDFLKSLFHDFELDFLQVTRAVKIKFEIDKKSI